MIHKHNRKFPDRKLCIFNLLICFWWRPLAPPATPCTPYLSRTLAVVSCKVLFACEDTPPHVNGYLVLSRHVERLLRSHYDHPLHFFIVKIIFIVNVTCRHQISYAIAMMMMIWRIHKYIWHINDLART